MIRSKGPFIDLPPTMGLIPRIRPLVFARALRIPGMARIGPMLRMGLLGQRIMTSDFSIDSTTPGAGVAMLAPSYLTSSTLSSNFLLTKYSWKSNSPAEVLILVATIWSVIGRILTFTPRNIRIFPVNADWLNPCWRKAVRRRWVAKSLSPIRNHVSAEYRCYLFRRIDLHKPVQETRCTNPACEAYH